MVLYYIISDMFTFIDPPEDVVKSCTELDRCDEWKSHDRGLGCCGLSNQTCIIPECGII